MGTLMSANTRIKLSADVDAALASAIEGLADKEGLPVDALVEEALSDVLAKHGYGKASGEVMAAYRKSHDQFAELYKKLAK